ncbi:MAG: hypothetical protein IPJ58_16690 [Ardenticatenia bacterium]|nr:hypothetical protein [Ardenticatenia bacterium]
MQRYTAFEVWDAGTEDNYTGGHVYLAADVDALLARIRAAVAAERGAWVAVAWLPLSEVHRDDQESLEADIGDHRAALDALLADGGA